MPPRAASTTTVITFLDENMRLRGRIERFLLNHAFFRTARLSWIGGQRLVAWATRNRGVRSNRLGATGKLAPSFPWMSSKKGPRSREVARQLEVPLSSEGWPSSCEAREHGYFFDASPHATVVGGAPGEAAPVKVVVFAGDVATRSSAAIGCAGDCRAVMLRKQEGHHRPNAPAATTAPPRRSTKGWCGFSASR